MPEPTPRTDAAELIASGDETPSSPLELLKAVKEVQERRIAVWHEYDDAFDTFLSHVPSSPSDPINGSQNDAPSAPHDANEESTGRCAGCSTTTVPLSDRLLAQIMQITTQGLIECGHRLRAIQTELAHSNAPQLAPLVDAIQNRENTVLRKVVERDQLRKTTLKPEDGQVERDEDEARERIKALDEEVKLVRTEIAELMQEVYAESVELQLAEG
ncbi:hypothetical protein PSEUBRA_004914 [Kalmanozyma brasiliensis GHG001]|nr:uncharacterized protein PSEUBRA_004914 [Kalmanozyma brasiliensis GHG001]EST05866.2 hypothetical protein PSEUBRA_004914 [Kalmanozyma brasiliensis GHG001]